MNPPATPPPTPRGRGAVTASIVALTIGLSGFYMGLRQTSVEAGQARGLNTPSPQPAQATAAPVADADVPQAVAYSRLRERTLQPNRSWNNKLATLERHEPDAAVFARLSVDEQQNVRQQRAARRQYDGAPPVSPHPLNQTTAAACLECHGRPVAISGIVVPQMSHQAYENCLQCHVSSAGPTSTWRSRTFSLADANAFTGKPSPGYGNRAYEGAPPVVPHPTWMRQNCMSCHGPGGAHSFRTPHPDRQSCLQCHAPDAAIDQTPLFVGNSRPPPLPAR